MKKALSLMLSLLLFSFSSCNTQNKKEVTTDNSIDTKNIEINQDIVFINQYSNYAWGYQCYGSFIDKNGKLYRFDFSDEERFIPDEEKLEKMTEIMKTEDAYSTDFHEESMKYLYTLLYKIDENAGFDEECVSCDAGQSTLYGVRYKDDGSSELIRIYSNGDWIIKSLDENAEKLYDYYYSVITMTDH